MGTNSLVSFWELLDNNEIVIPIIQRDYAQGRKGKEELRYRFLTSLHSALTGGEEIKLDFVYGGVEKKQMTPLDGQQRLTTLWLIHWYVAFRAGKLTDVSVRTKLKKFYYATRPSSTAFYRKLVDEFGKVDLISIKEMNDIVGFIKNQHWYYKYYENDPTIQATLLMIKGDREPYDKKREKPVNGLEQIFTGRYEDMWGCLTSPNCPIRFFHKDMENEDAPLIDDLYVKMNARGKQLTKFENFKAELIGYKTGEKRKQYFDIINCDLDRSFVSNLDNDWVRIFWPYKHHEFKRVDEIYFKFINQFMLNYYLIKSKSSDIDKTPLYNLLYDGNAFNKIEDYSLVLDDGFKEVFLHTMNGLSKCAAKSPELNKVFEDSFGYYLTFNVIPQFDSEVQSEDLDNIPLGRIGQIPQVLFFAVCRYFEMLERKEGVYDSDKLKDWIRFCYNICYNPLVNTVASMQAALRAINEVSERYCLDIYGEFGKLEKLPDFNSKAAEAQINEEFHKAKYANLKTEMENAEKYAFFKGSIRFLIWNENGEYPDSIDTVNFNNKLNNAKKCFSNDDTLEAKVKKKSVFRSYILNSTHIEELLSKDNNGEKCVRFNNSGEAWKAMLVNTSLCRATHSFLLGNGRTKDQLLTILQDSCSEDDEMVRIRFVLDTILDEEFVKDLEKLGDIVSGMLFLRVNGNWALYPKNAKSERKVLVLGTSRNSILNTLSSNPAFSCDQHVGKLYYGWYIHFTYKDVKLIWKWNGEVQMADNCGRTTTVSFNVESKAFTDAVDNLISTGK